MFARPAFVDETVKTPWSLDSGTKIVIDNRAALVVELESVTGMVMKLDNLKKKTHIDIVLLDTIRIALDVKTYRAFEIKTHGSLS